MAGTLYGIALSQPHDVLGKPFVGAKLYIYAAGTTTLSTVYQDTGLTVPHTNPMVADANGRIPQFWLADGTYRARLTTAVGIVQFDEDNILAIGPSSGGGGGGGATAISEMPVGFVSWQLLLDTYSGHIRANGRTIGSAFSGATERANSDCEALFLLLWALGFAVDGGAGASAAADWTAHKRIAVPDMRGRAPFGIDSMGSSAAGRITSATLATPDTPRTAGGVQTHVLTTAQMPVHTHVADAVAGHTHTFTRMTETDALVDIGAVPVRVGHTTNNEVITTSSAGGHTPIINNAGSGSAHTNMPPAMLGTWFIKL